MRQFFISLLLVTLLYGVAAGHYGFFPAPQLQYLLHQARMALGILQDDNQWFYLDADEIEMVPHIDKEKMAPGLTLLTGMGFNKTPTMKVIEASGEVVHQWHLDWYKIWPDATHIPRDRIPVGRPGTHVHGSRLMENGDILFNFENLGLVRLDICGNVVFRIPHPTHHSIHVDNSDIIWVPSQVNYTQIRADYPAFSPPYKDDIIAQVSPDGQLLDSLSVMDLFRANGYEGLMFMSTLSSRNPRPSGDLFHLNDVEVFPESLTEGIFRHGDVMISLRNINTILVYEPTTLTIRFISTGKVLRQHDPDFLDGNTISVYDNNHHPGQHTNRSRIVLMSAEDGSVRTHFYGSQDLPFYSNIMGKHQWLDNGNLLVLESMSGRVIELNKENKLVWEFNNLLPDEGKVGILEGAERLPDKFDKRFFRAASEACEGL